MRSEVVYLLVRADLPPGLQMAQAAHGAFEFTNNRPALVTQWRFGGSNSLVCLAVADEAELLTWAKRIERHNDEYCGDFVHWHLVQEPDIGNEATAIVVGPSEWGAANFSSLPLALRELAVT